MHETSTAAQPPSHNNNFNLLRLIAALMVMVGHCLPLTNNEYIFLDIDIGAWMPRLGVDIFFVISGYLVTQSLLARRNILAFVLARALRIIPGLFVALLFCVFVVGLLFTTLPATEYLQRAEIYNYITTNLLLRYTDFKLPGVFASNPYALGVNGSLWTLPWEIKMYLWLALLGWFTYAWPRLLSEKRLQVSIVILTCLILAIAFLQFYAGYFRDFSADGLRFASMFFTGSSLLVLRNMIPLRLWVVALTPALIMSAKKVFVTDDHNLVYIAYTLFFGYVVLYCALVPGGWLRRFNKAQDYSYGIYIYAFPIQQSIAALVPGISPLGMFCLALPVTLLLAYFSWHYIEQPMLAYKSRYIALQQQLTRWMLTLLTPR